MRRQSVAVASACVLACATSCASVAHSTDRPAQASQESQASATPSQPVRSAQSGGVSDGDSGTDNGNGLVPVPSVVGMAGINARQVLAGWGLTGVGGGNWIVERQYPAAGSLVPAHTLVNLVAYPPSQGGSGVDGSGMTGGYDEGEAGSG